MKKFLRFTTNLHHSVRNTPQQKCQCANLNPKFNFVHSISTTIEQLRMKITKQTILKFSSEFKLVAPRYT